MDAVATQGKAALAIEHIAVHFGGLVRRHALLRDARLAMARQREFPLARRHPLSGPQRERAGEEQQANGGEAKRLLGHRCHFHGLETDNRIARCRGCEIATARGSGSESCHPALES